MRPSVIFLSVLLGLGLVPYVSCSLQRYQFLLRFDVHPTGNQNFGVAAADQTMLTNIVSNGVCHHAHEAGNVGAIFRTSTSSDGTLFQAHGNVTFGEDTGGNRVFISSPKPGVAHSLGQLDYGAIPYEITSGSGIFTGARGAAADIFIATESESSFEVILLGIFYINVVDNSHHASIQRALRGASPQPGAATAPSCQEGKPPRVFPGNLCLSQFALTYTSTPMEPNLNHAKATSQLWSTRVDTVPVFSSTPFSDNWSFYNSSTGSPAPGYFNETGRINFGDSSFTFSSSTDGKVGSLGNVTYGSIAYAIPKEETRGPQFLGGQGVMVDVFEAFGDNPTFPIHAVGVVFVPCV